MNVATKWVYRLDSKMPEAKKVRNLSQVSAFVAISLENLIEAADRTDDAVWQGIGDDDLSRLVSKSERITAIGRQGEQKNGSETRGCRSQF